VLRNRAKPSLIETYEPERIAFARRLVETTDRAFIQVTSSRPTARFVRQRLAPLLAPLFFSFQTARRLIFRTVSQTSIEYRHSSLSRGMAGAVRGGDRLPWVAPLQSLDWQVHVYGEAKPEMQALCSERKLPLHVFPYSVVTRDAGLRRNAAYLLRPDGYVGLAEADGGAANIASYLDSRGLSPLRASTSG
jgi:hypothetical protein